MSEQILSEQIALAPPDVELFFNRPVIPPRDLTENSDWFISYDTYTDQILVLDLATGWSEIQRQTYSLHDDSPDYGIQNLNNLRDGILLKGRGWQFYTFWKNFRCDIRGGLTGLYVFYYSCQ